jgi:hypothetical protein
LYFDITKVKTKQTEQKVKQIRNKTEQNETDKHKTAHGTQVNKHDMEHIKHIKLQKQTKPKKKK